MARKRKTIDVSEVLMNANRLLAAPDSDHCTPAFRKGVAAMLESVLWATSNYNGFNYLGWAVEGGCERWREAGSPKDNAPFIGDETRRVYYGPREGVRTPKGGASVGLHFPKALL